MAETTITDRILLDAEQEANKIIDDAKEKAENIVEKANVAINMFINTKEAELIKIRNEIIERGKTSAELENRKRFLMAKKELISKAFEQTLQKIVNEIPDKEYLSIISGMLKHAENNDVVFISEKDKKRITQNFINEEAEALGINIKLASTFVDIKGGIILSNGICEKNFDMENEIALIREDIELEVSRILFDK